MREIEALRNELSKLDALDLERIQARSFTNLPQMDYAFFPGGNGFYRGRELREIPKVRVLFLGSDFACSANYVDENGQLLSGGDERGGATWRPMLAMLRDAWIPLEEAFFTNAWPVLHLPPERKAKAGCVVAKKVAKKSNLHPPIDLWRKQSQFMRLCIEFFLYELELLHPDLIVALGKAPALFLGDVWPEALPAWSDSGKRCLDRIHWAELDRAAIPIVAHKGRNYHCVAMNHPSNARLNAKNRRIELDGIPYIGIEGEIKLLCEAARRAGVL